MSAVLPSSGPSGRSGQGPRFSQRHLLSIADLNPYEILDLLDRAEAMIPVSRQERKTLPTLSGKTQINLFYEPSTRTQGSFEIAGKRLGALVMNMSVRTSSVTKGETLIDTAMTLNAMHADAIVIRHGSSGAVGLIADKVDCPVLNAGDGQHEHPTQGLLDLLTLRDHFKKLAGLKVCIVGDVLHSRVARSNILAFQKMGARVTVCGPPTLIPRHIEALGCEVRFTLDDLRQADVVYALRLQHERMDQAFVPTLREYASVYQINGRRLGTRQLLMHPGPVNRGVELSAEVIDAASSLIADQVASGLVVRMAIIYELLTGSERPRAAREPGADGELTALTPIGEPA